MQRVPALIVLPFLVLGLVHSAFAYNYYWNNPAGGSFFDNANWTPNEAPIYGDIAVFNIDATYDVTFPLAPSNNGFIVNRGSPRFLQTHIWNIQDSVTAPGIQIGVASGDDASLSIDNSTIMPLYAVIGRDAGSRGSLTLSNSSRITPNQLTIGRNGAGSLRIEENSTASTGPTWIASQPGSTGLLTVANYGELISADSFILGTDTANPGVATVVVDGKDYGHLRANTAVVYPRSSLSVSGAGARLEITKSISIGSTTSYVGDPARVSITDSASLIAPNAPITLRSRGVLEMLGGSITTSDLQLAGRFYGYGTFSSRISGLFGGIEVPASQTLTLAGPISFTGSSSSIYKSGPGTLVISGPQSHKYGNFSASAGRTILASNAGAPATPAAPADATFSLWISGAAEVILDSDQFLRNLTVDPAAPSRQSLDLNSHSLGIYSTNKSSLWSAISSANRLGAADPQDGIFDSTLPSHANAAIGLANLSDPHGDPYILIRPTRIGDLNLDGVITIADFIDLASHFNASGPNITWQEGDLNYDNAVTIADFIDLAANFGASYAGTTIPISAADQQMLSAFAAAHSSSVPEPTTFLLLFPLICLRRGR